MIKLVAVDLDGTLFAHGPNSVPDSAWAAIARGRDAGLRFAVCSGRPIGGLGLAYARRLDASGVHVFNDGASICDASGDPLHAEPLPHLAAIVGLAREHRLPYELMGASGGRHYEPGLMPAGLEAHVALTGVRAQAARVEDLDETVVRCWFVIHETAGWPLVRPQLGGMPEIDMVEYLGPSQVVAGVIRRGVSKSTGLAWLAAHHGISVADIAMIGDGDNDRDAIADAGLGIAMGNSSDAIKAVADHVTAHVDDDGFADAVRVIVERYR